MPARVLYRITKLKNCLRTGGGVLKRVSLMMLLVIAVTFDARSEGLKPDDRFEITDLMSSYALALDTKDYPLLRSLFSVDVEVTMIFDSDSPDGGEVKVTGIE